MKHGTPRLLHRLACESWLIPACPMPTSWMNAQIPNVIAIEEDICVQVQLVYAKADNYFDAARPTSCFDKSTLLPQTDSTSQRMAFPIPRGRLACLLPNHLVLRLSVLH